MTHLTFTAHSSDLNCFSFWWLQCWVLGKCFPSETLTHHDLGDRFWFVLYSDWKSVHTNFGKYENVQHLNQWSVMHLSAASPFKQIKTDHFNTKAWKLLRGMELLISAHRKIHVYGQRGWDTCLLKSPWCVTAVLSSCQAWTHHGAVELPHLSRKHPGLSDRRLLGVLQLGPVLHRTGTHHRSHGCYLLPLPDWAWVQPPHWLKGWIF